MEKEKKLYDFMRQMCCDESNKNTNCSRIGSVEITNRASFLCNVLKHFLVDYSVDKFLDERGSLSGTPRYYFNINISFPSDKKTDDSLIFVAHHDVNNVFSENCQDNTASVFNLIDLCNRLKLRNLDKNIHIVFTDGEEFGGKGARRLSQKILTGNYGNVLFVINSELTAVGDKLWAESNVYLGGLKNLIKEKNIKRKRTPFNDSVILRDFGVLSLCFGVLPQNEIDSDYPNNWSLCHSVEDTFSGANEEDMSNYVDFLESLI